MNRDRKILDLSRENVIVRHALHISNLTYERRLEEMVIALVEHNKQLESELLKIKRMEVAPYIVIKQELDK